MKPLLLALSILFAAGWSAKAQSSVRDLENYMVKLRNSPYESMPESILKDNTNEEKLIGALNSFFADTLDVVKRKAFYISKRIGQKSTKNGVQQKSIDQIIPLIKDKDTGLSGNAIEALTGFRKENFSQAAKDSIANVINPKAAHLSELLKLAGYLELKSQVFKFKSMLASELDVKEKWAIRVSLARMGDQEAVAWIVNKLQTAKVNDDFVYEIVPDLVYTRQKPVFKFLESIIYSEEEGCQSANPDSSKKILCGYRVMEEIAPYIKGFPLQTDASGDLMVADYKRALSEVRTWLASNPNYVISSDVY